MECFLECAPGYAPNLPPAVSCVGGRYVPNKPSEFSCKEAAAIIISSEGEVETFSADQKCNKMITNVPPHSIPKQTLNVFHNHLVVAGYSIKEGSWKYLSLEDASSSLLSSPWRVATTIGSPAPEAHISFTHGRSLVLVGGSQQGALKMDIQRIGGNWNSFSLPWANGTNFTSFTSNACGVKINKNEFLVIGGIDTTQNKVVSTIVKIDMKNELVKELPGLKVSRAFHACELVNGETILITGGKSSPDEHTGGIVLDEQYDLATEKSELNATSMKIPRYNHKLVLLGEKVFALGGRMANTSKVAMIEWFDSATNSWREQPGELGSHATGDLAIGSLARDSLDCMVGCSCGVRGPPGATRVTGNTSMAQVQP